MPRVNRNKIEEHEIKFKKRIIDMRRFAYDFIVYSAKRFDLSENCISIWEGRNNDYVYPDFFKIVSRTIFRHQITCRNDLYRFFNARYELNNLAEFSSVAEVFDDVFADARRIVPRDVFIELPFALSIASELVLFLYSKNSNLYLQKLADHWFQRYFKDKKEIFVRLQSLDNLYRNGRMQGDEPLDVFSDKFIMVHCSSYEQSASDEKLIDKLFQGVARFAENIKKYSKRQMDYSFVENIAEIALEIKSPPSTLKRNKAPEVRLPENTDISKTPQRSIQFKVSLVAGAESSENPAGVRFKISSTPCTGSSGEPERRQKQPTLCLNVEQGQASLTTSGAKQLSSKKLGVRTKNLPCTSKASRDSLPVNTVLGITPHDVLLREDISSIAGATSQNLPEASLQTSSKHRRGSSGMSKKRERLRSLRSNVGQTKFDNSGTKQTSERNPNVPIQNISSEIYKEPSRHRRGSSGQQESVTTLCSSVEQGLGQLSLESSGTKQSSKKRSSVSVARDPTSLQNLPSASREQAKE